MSQPIQIDIAEFANWARSKPPEQRYEYSCPWNCAISNFLKETGKAISPAVDPSGWEDEQGADRNLRHLIPDYLDRASVDSPNTYGALADRLERLL